MMTAKQRDMGILGFEWAQNYGFPVACGALPYIRLCYRRIQDHPPPLGQLST